MTIAVPDDLADKIRTAAHGNVSAWLTDLARDALLREEAAAIAVFERQHGDADWDDERWGG